MHVIILCDFAQPNGGSEKVALQSARALAEAGVEVTFLHAVPRRDPRLDHPKITALDLGLTDVWDRPMIAAATAGVWNAPARAAVEAHLRRLKRPGAVVHLHQWTRAFSPSVFAAVFAAGLPLVVTAHDYFVSCPNGVYYLFQSGRPCHLTPLGLGCIVTGCDPRSPAHKAVRVARSAATAAVLRGKSFDIIHVSDRGKATLEPLLPPGIVHRRLDNPIDVPQGSPARIGSDAAFAYIGRLTVEKGAVLAATAARRAGVPIVFVGEGPAATAIQTANPSAELLGWKPAAELRTLLAGSIRAVVAPSLWYETGPLTVAEAAAAGVPGIASATCGAAERIVPGVSGLVVAPEEAALADALRVLRDDAVARGMGAEAYARFWSDPPTPARHAAGLLTIYEDVLRAWNTRATA